MKQLLWGRAALVLRQYKLESSKRVQNQEMGRIGFRKWESGSIATHGGGGLYKSDSYMGHRECPILGNCLPA